MSVASILAGWLSCLIWLSVVCRAATQKGKMTTCRPPGNISSTLFACVTGSRWFPIPTEPEVHRFAHSMFIVGQDIFLAGGFASNSDKKVATVQKIVIPSPQNFDLKKTSWNHNSKLKNLLIIVNEVKHELKLKKNEMNDKIRTQKSLKWINICACLRIGTRARTNLVRPSL